MHRGSLAIRTIHANQETLRRTALIMKTNSEYPFGLVALFIANLLALVTAVSCSSPTMAQSTSPKATTDSGVTLAGEELSWPREFVDNGTKIDLYQPEIEKWEGTDFETRSAVAITEPGSNAPTYGDRGKHKARDCRGAIGCEGQQESQGRQLRSFAPICCVHRQVRHGAS